MALSQLRKKIAVHEQQLKKYELPDFPERDPDPEIVTPEQLYALKKLGYKNKNYVPVGRRGIYGGTIQNMHMHWKKHETVRIDCANFDKGVIKEMGEQLERLSGGTVIDIHQAKTIIMWRGRNYKRPKTDIPEVFKNFNKRKVIYCLCMLVFQYAVIMSIFFHFTVPISIVLILLFLSDAVLSDVSFEILLCISYVGLI